LITTRPRGDRLPRTQNRERSSPSVSSPRERSKRWGRWTRPKAEDGRFSATLLASAPLPQRLRRCGTFPPTVGPTASLAGPTGLLREHSSVFSLQSSRDLDHHETAEPLFPPLASEASVGGGGRGEAEDGGGGAHQQGPRTTPLPHWLRRCGTFPQRSALRPRWGNQHSSSWTDVEDDLWPTVERVLGLHADRCPVAGSIRAAIAITTHIAGR